MTDALEGDKDLARRLLAGNEEAFEEFFERHFPGLYRFALIRLGRDHGAAEEAAQAALCKAIGKLETYRGEATLFAWLCTFCRHEIASHFRARRRSPAEESLPEDAPEIRAALESLGRLAGTDPEAIFRRKEISRLVQVTLDCLPARYGDVLEWKYIEGLSVIDIAARLNLGPKAAESLLTRARQAFRDGFAAFQAGPAAISPGFSED